ncbi:MAG: DUF1343 domain-containing protein [Myxococcota bacterium]|nr:DUF1343 domain-containing protein [Myxococcota bacterium]MDW8362025.1 DUF1343 domain-containing protein [Myxococcales bacterium]
MTRAGPGVETGLDRLAAGEPAVVRLVRGRRVGLLAHPASVDQRFVHARERLMQAGARLGVLFGPEHGWDGDAQDMVGVQDRRDPVSGARVVSLYGEDEARLSPRPEELEEIDVLVVDLQDVGSRYYTFVWTAALAFRAAARAGVETVVLDRPNPLGGVRVEGAPQRPGHRSFVGLYEVAVRHGLTLGELLGMVRSVERIDDRLLTIVRARGWRRDLEHEATGLPWVLPSPNMPTPQTARVYPGGCLLEGTNLSEGRGTTRPFEIFGAPFLDGEALARAVRLDGAVLRPLVFRPTFHKYAGVRCGGVQVHVTDPARFRPYESYLRILAAVRALAPDAFRWRTEPYEFVSDRPAIDLLAGGPEWRTAIDAGTPLGPLLEADREAATRFDASRRAHWLYG